MANKLQPLNERSIKGAPLTIGALLLGLAGAFAIAHYVKTSDAETRAAATKAIGVHQDKDVDRAHPDLPKRYCSKVELQQAVSEVKADLAVIKADLAVIKESIAGMSNRRFHPHRSARRVASP